MITLQPITIKFEHTEEFDIDAYLEWCEDYDIQPSQRHYKKWAVDCLVDSLYDIVPEFQFIYGDSEEVEWKDKEENEAKEETFSYEDYVSDLTDEELQEFHHLCETDKMCLSPPYCKSNIIVMFNADAPTLSYGMIVGEDGEIHTIKKSEHNNYLFFYLHNLKDT
jgi:hypothetical protein